MAHINQLPPGWDEDRVRRVIAHYESQTEQQALAEDEAAFKHGRRTVVEVPAELMPVIRGLIQLLPQSMHAETTKSSSSKSRAKSLEAK
jgi:hypothetical protein